jgi:rod shape determining protein RodA
LSEQARSVRNVAFIDRLSSGYWLLVPVIMVVVGFGVVMLYSVAGGRVDPWVTRQLVRFGIGLAILVVVALIDIRVWLQAAYPFYALSLAMLALVPLVGTRVLGAQRWIDLGPFQLQPSEFMKIALVLALAAYYQYLPREKVSRPLWLIVPLALIAAPVLLVLKQPDLGTSLLLLAGGAGMIFAAGVHWGYFFTGAVAVLGAMPVAWTVLHDYQKQRILTFIDPERDPLGAGFHILQSKIAVGSGGIWGKGLLKGTQNQLNFLPERHTDFIFTMLAEELGLIGSVALLGVYFLLLMIGLRIAMASFNHFGRMVAVGVCLTFFLYVFVNVSMVMGLLPVVGVPLPLVSYGGTAMLTLMFGFGLLLNVAIHRNVDFSPEDKVMIWLRLPYLLIRRAVAWAADRLWTGRMGSVRERH